jgi:hypothetical protein
MTLKRLADVARPERPRQARAGSLWLCPVCALYTSEIEAVKMVINGPVWICWVCANAIARVVWLTKASV